MKKLVIAVAAVFLGGTLAFTWVEAQRNSKDVRREEQEDYFKKWLNEDVVYIITPEERSVFEKLSTPEEKEQFIEQFWYRRDPNPMTAINEYKEEHYRRIAYANERFASGLPGWMTDRGRIYIIHGPPDEIESHPSGGMYNRPAHEGGGSTSTYPFEVWRYRYIEGIGQDVVLEFVDPTWSGEFRLSLNPDEKDALLHVPGAGLTAAEQLGMATKADRPYFSPGNRERYPLMAQRARDNPFERYELYSKVQRAVPLKYKDLKQIVDIHVTYNDLPYRLRNDYFKLNEFQVLVPVTLEVDNRELAFQQEGDVYRAKVAVYGLVTSITNRIVTEFDDDLTVSYSPQDLEAGLQSKALYQKILTLDRKMRYKLDLVVKDLNSGKVGVKRQAIAPPKFEGEDLLVSSVILADFIRRLDSIPTEEKMFVLGDVWIHPSLDKKFPSGRPLGVYLQVYNTALDQASLNPSLHITYRILQNGETVARSVDEEGTSVQYFSGQRVVLIQSLPVAELPPGRYQLQVEIQDRVKNQSVSVQDQFELL